MLELLEASFQFGDEESEHHGAFTIGPDYVLLVQGSQSVQYGFREWVALVEAVKEGFSQFDGWADGLEA